MDTPIEEQQPFQSITCNIAASEHELNEPNILSIDFLNYVSQDYLGKLISVALNEPDTLSFLAARWEHSTVTWDFIVLCRLKLRY